MNAFDMADRLFQDTVETQVRQVMQSLQPHIVPLLPRQPDLERLLEQCVRCGVGAGVMAGIRLATTIPPA